MMAVFWKRGCWRIMSASSKPSISGMLTSVSTTAMSFFSRCSSASVAGSGLDEVFAEVAEDHFIAEQLRRLIVDHENVYLLADVSGRLLHHVAPND